MAEDGAAEIEMVVDSVRVHMRTGRHVLVLRETGHGRLLMIWVGVNEANAIAMKLQGVTPERPLTHDLMVDVLEAMSIRVEKIVISDLAEETYHARIVLVGADSPARGGLAAVGRDRARGAPGLDDLRHGGRPRPRRDLAGRPRRTRRATSPATRPGACRRRRSRRPASRSTRHASTSSASS